MAKEKTAAFAAEDVELMTELNALRVRNMELRADAEQCRKVTMAVIGDLEREKQKRKKELGGLTAFVGVGAALCVAGACWLAAPWWTAVAPLVLMVAVMRKAGWI
ncbi:MAG: hypothetical protein PUD44_10940 [Clostridiaceae bacterium]|nr:hypothetical protein [Clostridiaceae bacterium]